jgi:hypothetical protein
VACPGSGFIWETWALKAAVIPAKAGIHSVDTLFAKGGGVDSRLRGNDTRFKVDSIPNDTTTLVCMWLPKRIGQERIPRSGLVAAATPWLRTLAMSRLANISGKEAAKTFEKE